MFFSLDRKSGIRLSRQLYTRLREQILSGKIPAGSKLASTRDLSRKVSVSRNICLEVYEQLEAEGYLVTKKESGTFVADDILPMEDQRGTPVQNKKQIKPLPFHFDFSTGNPDYSVFPIELWGRYLRRAALAAGTQEMGYGNPAGLPELRQSLCLYLWEHTEINCRPENIIITAGSYQALILAGKLLGKKGEIAYMENPSYLVLVNIYRTMGQKLSPLSMEKDGPDLTPLNSKSDKTVSFCCVNPTHHFPTSTVMSIQKRLTLIEKAKKNSFYILENDYGGDFQFTGIPVSPIQTLCPEISLYTGTFSQLLFPGIRLGYIIVPDSLKEEALHFKQELAFDVPGIEQKALSLFIEEGELNRHRKRMTNLYEEKQSRFVEMISQKLAIPHRFSGLQTGLNIILELPDHDLDIVGRELIKKRLKTGFIKDNYWAGSCQSNALILNFATLPTDRMPEAVALLCQTLNNIAPVERSKANRDNAFRNETSPL